jgi:hypothetical protein
MMVFDYAEGNGKVIEIVTGQRNACSQLA